MCVNVLARIYGKSEQVGVKLGTKELLVESAENKNGNESSKFPNHVYVSPESISY